MQSVVVTDPLHDNLALWLNDDQRRWLSNMAEAANRIDDAGIAQSIRQESYDTQNEPRFGKSNPQLMELELWLYMVRSGVTAYRARVTFDDAYRAHDQYIVGLLKQKNWGPLSEEELNAAPPAKQSNPGWSFQRYGQTSTLLDDSREVWIGAAHEAHYDPDFYIYNDVVVIDWDLEVKIYGYPLEVFKPTDGHSATLVGESIYIIGCLGYHGTRRPGETPVYRLNCRTFEMETITTHGDNPGWIHGHKAVYVAERNAIKITQGNVFASFESKKPWRKNRASYWLNLATGEWVRGKRG